MSTHTYAEIVKAARTCKNNVEKNKKLGINSKWSYYFAQAILNPKKNITRISFTKAPNPRGDTIVNQKITKADYMDCCKRIIAFTKKNKNLPNFCTWKSKNKKIRVRTYTYNLAKILVYYADHNTLPAYNTINTDIWKKNTIKKYGRSTAYGCNNRGQNNGYYCGPHMIQEIIRNLTGKVISQSTLAEVIGTTYDGSDHDGLNTAIAWFNKKYGYNLKVEWKNFSDLGWSGIKKILESNNQDCGVHELYRNTWGHYTNFDKIYGDYIDVHNSLGDYCDYDCYCGYTEERYKSTAESYLRGISQKSVMVVTNEG
jgi:hypothetical protein